MSGSVKRFVGVVQGLLLAGMLAAGCVDRSTPCAVGASPCSGSCVDLASDAANCGGCGVVCGGGRVCQQSSCVCAEGSQACAGACVVTTQDGQNCGACGAACGVGQVCEAGRCETSCTTGRTVCAGGCVDVAVDSLHCGACGQACGAGQSCRGSRCVYDLAVACFDNGSVVGVSAHTGVKGPVAAVGAGPQRLAAWNETLWVADGIDQTMRGLDASKLIESGRQVAIGRSPQSVLVEPPYVYVVSSTSNLLQIFRSTSQSASAEAAGLELLATLRLDANTSPQSAVKVGHLLYVPLFGGLGTGASAGQKVLRVDVSDPLLPKIVGEYDLSTLDLKPFPGKAPLPRPYEIVHADGVLYVTLNNLAAGADGSLAPGGPGMLARIELATGNLSTIDLGADVCLNAVSLLETEQQLLVVSCAGLSDWSQWPTVTTEKSGVVLVSPTGERKGAWALQCPAGATDCAPPLAGRLAKVGSRLFVGDQSLGRLFSLQVSASSLTEERGFATGGPIAACAVDPDKGYSSVMDVVALP